MKILIVSPVGEEVHVRKIPAALAKHAGTEVTVIAPEKSATETAYEASGWRTVKADEVKNGFRLTALALREPANPFRGFETGGLERILRETQADVIQMWGAAPAACAEQVVWMKIRASRRSKLVFYGFDQLPYRFAPLTQLRWKFLWSQMAGGVEANSEGVMALRQAGFRKPLERIFWGISTEEFHPVEKAGLRERLGLGREKIVGFVGRFVMEKGLADLLAALRQMPSEVHGVLIGAGPMRQELEREATAPELRGRVRFFPTMPPEKLVEYMNCFDALALPSRTTPHWKEQYGRVIGEAMACGVPVVGSDSGAIPEVIGEAGIIVREGDARALAEGLEKAMCHESTRSRIIPAGMHRAERELSVQAMSRRLLDFYERLLGEATSSE